VYVSHNMVEYLALIDRTHIPTHLACVAAVAAAIAGGHAVPAAIPFSETLADAHAQALKIANSLATLMKGLCARSWLARHPAKIEITGSSGGSSHHTKIFFFCKNHDFSRFLINFSTVVVVKHTHVVDPKRLTHIHSHRDLNSLSLSTESTYLLVPMP
jgi:hypothetical protein